MLQYKTCSKCKQTKQISLFNNKASTKDGKRSACRDCELIARREYYAKPFSKRLIYSQLLESQKAINRLRSRNWNKENNDKRTLAMAKRRALQKGNGVYVVTPKEIIKIKNSRCFYCGNLGGEVDHVIPLTRGGSHSIGNLVPACRTCNSSKNNRLIMEWKKKKGYQRNLQR